MTIKMRMMVTIASMIMKIVGDNNIDDNEDDGDNSIDDKAGDDYDDVMVMTITATIVNKDYR